MRIKKLIDQLIPNRLSKITYILLIFFNLIAFIFSYRLGLQNLKQQIQNHRESMEITIEDNLRESQLSLKRMGNRWNQNNGTKEKIWRSDARAYSNDLLGIVGVGYADSSTKIKWIEPIEKNSNAVGFQLNSEERRRIAATKALNQKNLMMTLPINLKQGGRGYLILYPVFKNEIHDGFVYLVGRYKDYFPELVRDQNFFYQIYSGNEIVFSNIETNLENFENVYSISDKSINYSIDWKLKTVASLNYYKQTINLFTFWTLFVSLLLTIVIIFILYLYNKSQSLSAQLTSQNVWKNAILNNTDLVVISTDKNGYVVSINTAGQTMLGYEEKELVGIKNPMLWHDEQEVLNFSNELFKEFGIKLVPGFEVIVAKSKIGQTEKNIWTIISKSGIRKQAFVSIYPLIGKNYEIEGYVEIIEKISDHLEFEELIATKEILINSMLENTFDGFWDWNLKIDYQYMSPKFWEMLGYNPLEKPHHPSEWQKVISPEGLKLTLENLEKHINSKGTFPFSQEVKFIHKDGHDVWVLSKGKVVDWDEDGSPIRAIGTNTDITEIKKKNEIIEKTQKDLIERDRKILELKNRSEDWFRIIANSLPQLIWTCEPEGPCDYLSEQWIEYTGIPENEQLGFEWLKQIHHDDQPRVIDEWQKNINNEKVFSIRFRIRRYDGIYNWFDTKAIPIKDSNQKIIRWLGSNTNVQELYTIQETLEDTKARLELALEGANIGIWEWDIRQNKLVWDDQMFIIYGQKKENFTNVYDAWSKGLHPDDLASATDDINHSLSTLQPFQSQFRVVKENGDIAYVLARAKLLQDSEGNASKMIGFNLDITKLKLNEIELEKAKSEALQSSMAKAQFLANMSHEIRTPINGILGISQLLKDTNLDNLQKEYLEHISQSGTILLSLINDILDLSKIESGKIDIESIDFNLEQTIDFVLSTLKYSAENKGLHLSNEYDSNSPRWYKGDPSRIKQVLLNFVNNAIKFTHEGSIRVKTNITAAANQTHKIRIEVIDTGIGISDENIPKLFHKFTQSDSSTHRKFGGTGLGLSISKLLIERMGGIIGLESTLGEGSTFWFELELPLGVENLNYQEDIFKIEESEIKPNVKILVAEDNIINQKVTIALLKKLGYESQVVANGFEVLSILNTIHFDLILMDCQMPEMDGFEATERIRNSNSSISNITIIAMTANAMEGDREKCIAIGMNDYLTKPVSLKDLSITLKKWLSTKVK
ncbi:PAS domain-containing protein [Leptospira levettii]|uniref:PAS domain-containing protein n=1 Tax=Leptospira levettii TaxID=2023178 RepID=UPI000C2A801A|nr:PAS domain-containing protein [Leptospira levettii]PJZ88323.1 hypothetical protein CH368_12210 [Leptospira levettii]